MSKYIDRADRIKNELIVPKADILFGIEYALRFLDDNPGQVPGRTITESDYSDITEWARDYIDRGWEGRTVLADAGITIVPDPEPTNAELLAELIREIGYDIRHNGRLSGSNALALDLDSRGVKAAGGSR